MDEKAEQSPSRMDFSLCPSDTTLGPFVNGCRDGFDFTFRFENTIFSLVPASCFVVIALLRIPWLLCRPTIVDFSQLQCFKAAIITIYAMLNLALVVLSASAVALEKLELVASNVLQLVASLLMIPLSWFEHRSSPKPSVLLDTYLFFTLVLDLIRARSLWLASSTAASSRRNFTVIFTVGIGIKAVVIVAEAWSKSRWLRWNKQKHGPEESSGIYSLGSFTWINRLFARGYTKVLTLDDLFPLDEALRSEGLGHRLRHQLKRRPTRGQNFGLTKALVRVLVMPLLHPVLPRLALLAFKFCQPFLIQAVLSYVDLPSTERSSIVGYGLIIATLATYAGIAIFTALYNYFHERALWMVRGALVTVIYSQTTQSLISGTEHYDALVIMSTDIERIRNGLLHLHDFWATVVQVGLAAWLLYRQLGISCLAPIVVVVLSLIGVMMLGRISGNLQKRWLERTERRVGLTSNIISRLKHVKISGLANPVEKLVQQLRLDELGAGSKYWAMECTAVVISFIPATISPVVAFAFTASTLDATRIFTAMSYILLLTEPLNVLFQTVPLFVASLACLGRIQTFLERNPRIDYRQEGQAGQVIVTNKADNEKSQATAKVTKGSFGWEQEKFHLIDLSFDLVPGLTLVVGPVACGKSTLCKALLGEASAHGGIVLIESNANRVGYCDQSPFLLNATIRDNIVGHSQFVPERYQAVVEAAMLLPDFATLPQGDRTKVGSDGITLSGGQKQRISIARALYFESRFFIFDDVLSGLDANTEEQVFQRVFGPSGLLRQWNATVLLCTHALHRLASADNILVLRDGGTLAAQGTFQALVEMGESIHGLDLLKPERSVSAMSEGHSAFVDVKAEGGPYPPDTAGPSDSVDEAKMLKQTSDWSVYKHYAKSMSPLAPLTALLLGVAVGVFFNFPQVWLDFWSEDVASSHRAHIDGYWIGLYALLQVLFLVSIGAICVVIFVTINSQSGATLHHQALQTVMNAPLNFLSQTDVGVVTNLFSQDLTLIDTELPDSLLEFIIEIFIFLGMAALVASSSPYIVISYPTLILTLWLIQRLYLRTSKQLRILDLEMKSPLYTHFRDTINGLATLRAFAWIDRYQQVGAQLLDNSQRPAYLLAMIQHWLNFVLNLLVTAMALLVVAVTTQVKLVSGVGLTGASLVTLMGFGESISQLITVYTRLETSIGAVSRLKTFGETVASEKLPEEDVLPPPSWPSHGEIEIQNVSASYGHPGAVDAAEREPFENDTHLVLKDLNLTIKAGEKVAICGRSGSGKSSIILLLLRLLNWSSRSTGTILVDGISLDKVDRFALRERVIAVPQEPVFLPDGTSFKTNLDPTEGLTEDECREVLGMVGLEDVVGQRGGMSTGMWANTLSQGQRQLFSLARAMVRRRIRARQAQTLGGVLLLDEVSSSVDKDAHLKMQNLFKGEFARYTVIAVLHRLDVVMDYDRVIVMDNGRVVESGEPRELAQRENGCFNRLWAAAQ